MARVANEEARPRQAVLSLANETELGKCMVNSGSAVGEQDRHDGNRLVAEQPFDNEGVGVTETGLEWILNPGTQFATDV
jgi:hypothetical protein